MGNTPLHLAVAANKMPVVMLLLKAGADVTCLDHEGNSLLKLAQRKLSLLQNCADTETSKIKEEVQSIIDMLVSCLQQQKDIEADRKIETLVSIYSRLILSNTPNKVQSDVKDLLASLDGLSIGNQPADC
ncbi:ankyrin repeat domain-containing protein 54-like [Ceratina calcarata]|nr:ankyrin repeat domain-containing protein 54-like [Ceratina calcarata]